MNTLLVFFAIPIAVIILSVILETFIKNPIKVAGIFFAIFLVVAFALGGTAELIVLAIVYTILSFISAYLTSMICCRRRYCPVERECCQAERNNFCNNNVRVAERVIAEPVIRNVYTENIEENNFTNAFNDDNGFTNNLNSNNSVNTNNNCPYRRYR